MSTDPPSEVEWQIRRSAVLRDSEGMPALLVRGTLPNGASIGPFSLTTADAKELVRALGAVINADDRRDVRAGGR